MRTRSVATLLISTSVLVALVVWRWWQVPLSSAPISSLSPSPAPVSSIPSSSPSLQPFYDHGSREQKNVALTFDADMTPAMAKALDTGKVKSFFNQEVADTLIKNHIPATVFITGLWAEHYPDIVKSWAKDPNFELANHSYDHAAFTSQCYNLPAAADKDAEVSKTQTILTTLTGTHPHFFRFPGGCYDTKDLQFPTEQGLITIGWDVISGDAFLKDAQTIVKNTVSQVKNGSIIVMHISAGVASKTAEALPDIITQLTKKGFNFVTVGQLLQTSEKLKEGKTR